MQYFATERGHKRQEPIVMLGVGTGSARVLSQSFFEEVTGISDALGCQIALTVESNKNCLGRDRGWDPRSKQGGKTYHDLLHIMEIVSFPNPQATVVLLSLTVPVFHW